MKPRLLLAFSWLTLFAGCSDDAPNALSGSRAPIHAADGNALPVSSGTGAITASYSGRALYRSTGIPVAGLTIEVSTAKADGSPTDDIFGETHTDTHGHFTVDSTVPEGQRVVLVAAAVKEIAETGGDRRAEGYDVRKLETVLGTLLSPNASGPNTLLVTPKRPRSSGE